MLFFSCYRYCLENESLLWKKYSLKIEGAIMKNTLIIIFFAISLFALFYNPTFVFGATFFFDFDGNVINKVQYEVIASNREKEISMKLRNGYNENFNVWKDPIKLRKKRIEQWRIMRSHYSLDSLPIKIENSSTKNK
jgi:predicted membrane protein